MQVRLPSTWRNGISWAECAGDGPHRLRWPKVSWSIPGTRIAIPLRSQRAKNMSATALRRLYTALNMEQNTGGYKMSTERKPPSAECGLYGSFHAPRLKREPPLGASMRMARVCRCDMPHLHELMRLNEQLRAVVGPHARYGKPIAQPISS